MHWHVMSIFIFEMFFRKIADFLKNISTYYIDPQYICKDNKALIFL